MSDLMKILYVFVCERRMGSVYEDPEYVEMSHSVELQLQKVRRGLDEAQQVELDLLLHNIEAQNTIECEHLFQAALGLARELGRGAA